MKNWNNKATWSIYEITHKRMPGIRCGPIEIISFSLDRELEGSSRGIYVSSPSMYPFANLDVGDKIAINTSDLFCGGLGVILDNDNACFFSSRWEDKCREMEREKKEIETQLRVEQAKNEQKFIEQLQIKEKNNKLVSKKLDNLRYEYAIMQIKYNKLLEKSIDSRSKELENFAVNKLGIDFNMLYELQELHEKWIKAKEEGEDEVASKYGGEIANKKTELSKRNIVFDDIRKLFKQCEETAKTNIEIGKIGKRKHERKLEDEKIVKVNLKELIEQTKGKWNSDLKNNELDLETKVLISFPEEGREELQTQVEIPPKK